MSKVKFAVVGCGHIGKRHIEMILHNPEAELIAVCDILPKEQLGISSLNIPFFQTLAELLESNNDLDIINICTPNGFHAQQAKEVLLHDKHVVIEKPMALNKKDCLDVMEIAAQKQKQIFCVMQNRFSPPSVWIKNIVVNKLLGKIFLVQVNCFWNRDERYYYPNTWHGKADLDGGTLFTQFSHFVDTMAWLFGDIKNIQAKFADFNHQKLTAFEDSGLIQFDFCSGGIGTINYSSSVYDSNYESSIRIIGELGTVEIGGQYMNEVKYCNIRDYIIPELEKTGEANNYGSYSGSASNHHHIIQNIIDVLNHSGKIATTAEEGMLVVDIIERIYHLRPMGLWNKK